MDPYRLLGVSTTCTREEVKAAFRAAAWHAHPDRGGTEAAFIELCAAYKQILEEQDRRPAPVPRDRARPSRHGRPWAPSDRLWEPEFILLDEPPGSDRPPTPPLPDWQPDLILLDEPPPAGQARGPISPGVAGTPYAAWLRRVSHRVSRRESDSIWRSRTVQTIGVLLLFGILGGNLWLCWVAWSYDPEQAGKSQPAAAVEPSGFRR